MKTIENAEQLTDWAKRVNNSLKPKEICDLQDEFMRTNCNLIKTLWLEVCKTENKRIVLFSVHKILSDDIFFDLVNLYAKTKAQEVFDKDSERLEKEWSKLLDAETRFNESKKAIHKKIQRHKKKSEELRRKVVHLQERNDMLQFNLSEISKSYHRAMNSLQSYDKLAQGLKEIIKIERGNS